MPPSTKSSNSVVLTDGDNVLFKRSAAKDISASDLYTLGTVQALNRGTKTATILCGQDGSTHNIAISELMPFSYSTSALDTLHDLCLLPEVHDPAVLYTIQQRFRARKIYSYVGPMLVSVNPFQWLQGLGENPEEPHPNHLTRQAWEYLLGGGLGKQDGASTFENDAGNTGSSGVSGAKSISSSQSNRAVVVITGQSGAGKTEAAKMVVNHLTTLGGGVAAATLSKRLHIIDPILESFGNAATTNNANSSRFAKFLDISICPINNGSGGDGNSGTIESASVECFLLEVSRVVKRNPNEGNFHIFHLLFSSGDGGLTDAERTDLDLWDPLLFASMKDSVVPGEEKRCPYTLHEVREAMATIGVNDEDQKAVWRTLAGVLHLLNIQFEATDAHSPATVSTPTSVETAARLLGLDTLPPQQAAAAAAANGGVAPVVGGSRLSAMLTTVAFNIQGKLQMKRLAKPAAMATRDTMAKVLFEGVFQYLLKAINKSLAHPDASSSSSSSAKSMKHLGILDIFGFETVDPANGTNDLEQLLINYTNEAVQGLYDDKIFGAHKLEAETEGVILPPLSSQETKATAGGQNNSSPSSPTGSRASIEDNMAIQKALEGLSVEEQRKRCLQVMLEKPFGVLSVISDESALGQQGSAQQAAQNLADKILSIQKTYPDVLRRDRIKKNIFRLNHYCALVEYTVDNFTLKNRIHTAAAMSLKESCVPFVAQLYDLQQGALSVTGHASGSAGGGRVAASAATKAVTSQIQVFRDQLQRLLAIMNNAQLFWVRCIKPNLSKSPMVFNSSLCLEQLQTNGITRTLALLGEGYSVRLKYDVLAKDLIPALTLPASRGGGSGFPTALVHDCAYRKIVEDAIQKLRCCGDGALILGATRAFMKRSTLRDISQLSGKFVGLAAQRWQKALRAFGVRKALYCDLQARKKDELKRAKMDRIECERGTRELLERQREQLLDEDSQVRLLTLPKIHAKASENCTQTMKKFQQAVDRLSQDLARVCNEVAAVNAASEAKEMMHQEYEHYSEVFRKQVAAKAQMEKQKKFEAQQLKKKQEIEREMHYKAAHKEEIAMKEKQERMTKVYLGARALQLKAETRFLADQKQEREDEQQRKMGKQVDAHLALARKRLQQREVLQQHQADKDMARGGGAYRGPSRSPSRSKEQTTSYHASSVSSQPRPLPTSTGKKASRSSSAAPLMSPNDNGQAAAALSFAEESAGLAGAATGSSGGLSSSDADQQQRLLDDQWAAKQELFALLEDAVAEGERSAWVGPDPYQTSHHVDAFHPHDVHQERSASSSRNAARTTVAKQSTPKYINYPTPREGGVPSGTRTTKKPPTAAGRSMRF